MKCVRATSRKGRALRARAWRCVGVGKALTLSLMSTKESQPRKARKAKGGRHLVAPARRGSSLSSDVLECADWGPTPQFQGKQPEKNKNVEACANGAPPPVPSSADALCGLVTKADGAGGTSFRIMCDAEGCNEPRAPSRQRRQGWEGIFP